MRGTALTDLNPEVQQVVMWVAQKYEETALWPTQAWVWREIAKKRLRHDVVVGKGTEVFDHLGSPPNEQEHVRLRPWVLYDSGYCRLAFDRAYEVCQEVQARLHYEDSVTITRKETLQPRAGQEAIFKELRSHGLLKTHGVGTQRWALTDAGVRRAVAAVAAIPRTIVDVLVIAGRDEASVAKKLGIPASAKETKDGPTSTYALANGVEVEVVYFDGKAEWITITPGSGVQIHFDENALRTLGLPTSPPSFQSSAVLRWGNIGGLLEVSIFPGPGESVDYFYIKAQRP